MGASRAPTDPQVDVDDDVRRHERIRRWLSYAAENRAMSDLLTGRCDVTGAALATARAQVRDLAANLLYEEPDPHHVAQLMWQRAQVLAVRVPPTTEEAALDYVRARTWQSCAREVDPGLPEVQPQWGGV
jgi:hypothetical protein